MELYSTPSNPLAVRGANAHGAGVSFEAIPAVEYAPYLLVKQDAPGIPGLEPEKVKLGLVFRPGTSFDQANWIAQELNTHIEAMICRRDE